MIYHRPHLLKVLAEHRPVLPSGQCSCGWGRYYENLKRTHAEHVADEYERGCS